MLDLTLRLRRRDFDLDVSFQASEGITVLYGPSGAGKSTILDCIAGAVRPAEGRVVLDGTVLLDTARNIDVAPRQRRTPRVYQEGRLFPHLTVRQNLLYGTGRRHGSLGHPQASLEEVVEVLEIGGLLARRPAELSAGQRQRVAMGRAILAAPRALLLDEPLASLDLDLRRRILPYLRSLEQRFAIPFVYVTHAPEEALVLARRMVRLDHGRIVAQGSAMEVLGHGAGAPAMALSEGDTVLAVTVDSHHDDQGITTCRLGAVRLRALRLDLPEGRRLFLALSARDLVLAAQAPAGLSARNCLPATVDAIERQRSSVMVDLRLRDAPPDAPPLRTMVTAAAAAEMKLTPQRAVFVIFKSSALRPILS